MNRDWADTPEDTDYIADQLLDHQDRDTGWDLGITWDRPMCTCLLPVHNPYCWAPAREAHKQNIQRLGGAA